MKKTFCYILTVLLLTGCSTITEKESIPKNNKNVSEETYTASTYITKDMKKKAGEASSITAETISKTIGEWSEDADLVVLATVISIDEAKTVLASGITDELGFTFSTILVQQTYKGEDMNGKTLKTLKQGGILTQAQIEQASDPEAVKKHEYLRKKNGGEDPANIYVNTNLENDVMLEEGKTYLLLLNYVKEEDRYEILGLNNCTREAQIPQTRTIRQRNFKKDEIKLKNYDTQEFESLDSVLSQIR